MPPFDLILPERKKQMFIWICIMIGAIFIDQITKWLAVIFLQGGEVIRWPVVDLFIQFR